LCRASAIGEHLDAARRFQRAESLRLLVPETRFLDVGNDGAGAAAAANGSASLEDTFLALVAESAEAA